MDLAFFHIVVGWSSMLGGAISGALIGLFFHKQDWAGGYGSFRRRLMRLGHIAFFGLGILNILFALSLEVLALPASQSAIASVGFLVAVIVMPLCCFLTAWRDYFRHLFFIPVLAVVAGIVPMIFGGFI
ncbi:MAG: hypothetical protein OEZ38_04285 [Gammaproteobacteria bacterium]|nr:hypothetical protein [Gammaproteobacteria bacterium]